MKVLVAGFGSIGRRHMNNLRAHGINDIILYRTHHSTLPLEEIGNAIVETDLEAALAHSPQAVVVANPTALHLDVAIPAAKAGCSILMEKPVSHSMQGIPELHYALEIGGGSFLTGFQYRFHPGLQQVKKWLEAGSIGQVTTIRCVWGEYLPGWHPWENYRESYSARADLGGGVVNTLCHPLDYLRWMFGEVREVFAVTSDLGLHLPVEDTADILLRFENGETANVHLDYLLRPGQHTLQITGTGGSIEWDNASGIARKYDTQRGLWEDVSPPAGFERNHLFMAEMGHFLRVASGEEAPVCTLEDGIAALQLTLAVHRSAGQGVLVKF
jgi:predicted dehydrogenase